MQCERGKCQESIEDCAAAAGGWDVLMRWLTRRGWRKSVPPPRCFRRTDRRVVGLLWSVAATRYRLRKYEKSGHQDDTCMGVNALYAKAVGLSAHL